jgi:hypothetical protein
MHMQTIWSQGRGCRRERKETPDHPINLEIAEKEKEKENCLIAFVAWCLLKDGRKTFQRGARQK